MFCQEQSPLARHRTGNLVRNSDEGDETEAFMRRLSNVHDRDYSQSKANYLPNTSDITLRMLSRREIGNAGKQTH